MIMKVRRENLMVDDEQIAELVCEGCKGYPGDPSCRAYCDPFKIAVYIEELGLGEYYNDWYGPGAKYEAGIRKFLSEIVQEKRRQENV
jgi:hypothetical protein